MCHKSFHLLFLLKFDAVDFYKFAFIGPILKQVYKLERNAIDNFEHCIMDYLLSNLVRVWPAGS
jgi:hypothetical protein